MKKKFPKFIHEGANSFSNTHNGEGNSNQETQGYVDICAVRYMFAALFIDCAIASVPESGAEKIKKVKKVELQAVPAKKRKGECKTTN
jgi:hypothetical protein